MEQTLKPVINNADPISLDIDVHIYRALWHEALFGCVPHCAEAALIARGYAEE